MFKFAVRKSKDLKEYSKEISQYDKIKEESLEIKRMAESLFNHKEKVKSARVETFLDAQLRNGLTNEDLVEKMYDLNKMFYLCFYCILIVTLVLVYFIVTMKIMSALITLVVIGILSANAFKFSFRFFQFKYKSLCPVSDWVSSRSDWIPKRMKQSEMFLLKNEAKFKDNEYLREEHQRFLKELEIRKKNDEKLTAEREMMYEKIKNGDLSDIKFSDELDK